MKRIIITESEVCAIPELVELFCLTENEIENCEVNDIFNSDPDYFSWGIKDHLHKIPFVEVLDKYIIVPVDYMIEYASDDKISNGLSDKCKEMLIRFFQDDFKIWFTSVECSWKNFDGLNFGIAYRGGSGYSYSIWNYRNKNK